MVQCSPAATGARRAEVWIEGLREPRQKRKGTQRRRRGREELQGQSFGGGASGGASRGGASGAELRAEAPRPGRSCRIRCRMASASPVATMSGRGARNLLQFLRLVGQLKVSGHREGCLSSRLRRERPGPSAGQPGFRSPPGLRPAPFLGSPRLVGPAEEALP